MSYTLGKAAKTTGKSKTSILRGIRKGLFSANKDEFLGVWQIDPSELHRVYPLIVQPEQVTVTKVVLWHDAERVGVTHLHERLADKDAMIAALHETIAQLREDRDHWRVQAQRLALTYQASERSAVGQQPSP